MVGYDIDMEKDNLIIALKTENYKLLDKIVTLQWELDQRDAIIYTHLYPQAIEKW